MRERPTAVALVLAAAAIWGSSFVVIKVGLEGAPPVTSSLLRFAIAGAVSGVALARLGPFPRGVLKDPLVVGLAATNAAGFVLQYLGLADTNSAVAALLANLGVIVVAALSALYLKEKLHAVTVAAVVMAFAGGSLLATRGDLSTVGTTQFRAAILIAVASVLWSLYVVINKLALMRTSHSEEQIAWAVLALTALMTAPVAVALEGVPTMAYSASAWGSIAYAGVLCSSLSYVIYMKGLRRLTATATAVLTVSEVLVAFALTAVVYGYVVRDVAAVGAALVLGGILLASRAPQPRLEGGAAPGSHQPEDDERDREGEKHDGAAKQGDRAVR